MKTVLVRLYPRRWRDRYGDEFEAMLEQQPTNLGSVADVLLGALDAHLTADAPERRGWWLSRLPGLTIAFGALVWSVSFAIRESGIDQEVTNLASMFAPMGQVLVGLGVLALPPLWIGGSRWSRWSNVGLAVAIIVGGSLAHALHVLGLRDRSEVALALLLWTASLVWAAAMLARSRLPRVPIVVLAVFSATLMAMIPSGHFGYDYDPTVGPGIDFPIRDRRGCVVGDRVTGGVGGHAHVGKCGLVGSAPGRPGPDL